MDTLTTTRDQLEADARKAMARCAAIEVRGFDTKRAHDDEVALVDALLDAWLALG